MTQPKWILNDDWGVGIDPLNWKIYQRVHDRKTRERKGPIYPFFEVKKTPPMGGIFL